MSLNLKTQFLFLSILALISACTKTETPPAETPKSNFENLVGTTSKVWGISELYINDTLFPLDNVQLQYTKTYKKDNSFEDSDGFKGTYTLSADGKTLVETTTSGGTGVNTYTVNSISASKLDVKLTSNGTSTLNNRFVFNAK
jgi:hypothetical protein